MEEEPHSLRGLSQAAFEKLFRQYYEELYYYACRYLWRREDAEEAVQDVFVRVWEKREELQISTSVKAYLYAAVRNRAINHLNSRWAREAPLPLDPATPVMAEAAEDELGQETLIQLLQQGIYLDQGSFSAVANIGNGRFCSLHIIIPSCLRCCRAHLNAKQLLLDRIVQVTCQPLPFFFRSQFTGLL